MVARQDGFQGADLESMVEINGVYLVYEGQFLSI